LFKGGEQRRKFAKGGEKRGLSAAEKKLGRKGGKLPKGATGDPKRLAGGRCQVGYENKRRSRRKESAGF